MDHSQQTGIAALWYGLTGWLGGVGMPLRAMVVAGALLWAVILGMLLLRLAFRFAPAALHLGRRALLSAILLVVFLTLALVFLPLALADYAVLSVRGSVWTPLNKLARPLGEGALPGLQQRLLRIWKSAPLQKKSPALGTLFTGAAI